MVAYSVSADAESEEGSIIKVVISYGHTKAKTCLRKSTQYVVGDIGFEPMTFAL